MALLRGTGALRARPAAEGKQGQRPDTPPALLFAKTVTRCLQSRCKRPDRSGRGSGLRGGGATYETSSGSTERGASDIGCKEKP